MNDRSLFDEKDMKDKLAQVRARCLFWYVQTRRSQQQSEMSFPTLSKMLSFDTPAECVQAMPAVLHYMTKAPQINVKWNGSKLTMSWLGVAKGEDLSDKVKTIWQHYLAQLDAIPGREPDRMQLTAKRRSMIQARLKEGATVKQICDAITAMTTNPFNLGQNKRGKTYVNLSTCLRSRDKLEVYMRQASEKISTPQGTTKGDKLKSRLKGKLAG